MQNEMTEFMQHIPLILVLYDTWQSSAYCTQALEPFIEHKIKHPGRIIHVIIFTNRLISLPVVPGITIHIDAKSHFFRPAIHTLHTFLRLFPQYELVALNAWAGYICLYARNARCIQLTLKVDQILSHSYAHQYKDSFILTHWIRAWHAKFIEKREKWVYRSHQLKIEPVSTEIYNLLINHFAVAKQSLQATSTTE